MITTQKELREAFWQGSPHFRARYHSKKRQNEFNTTIRSEWVEFVDMMVRDGQISESLAQRATL